MSLSDRLGRLLFIVPYVAQRDGVPINEIAQLLDVTPRQIEADIALLIMVGRPPLTPDHLIDLYIEDNCVYAQLDQNLHRPLRLTHDEARALILGAKLVGPLGGLGQELLEVLGKITEQLNPVDRAALATLSERIRIWHGGIQDATLQDWGELLRRAIATHRQVEVDYYSASSAAQKRYTLRPLALLTHTGIDYLVAFDKPPPAAEKLFRLDRLSSVTLTEQLFDPPIDFDLQKFRTPRLYSGGGDSAQLRFSPAVARAIAERFAAEVIDYGADGSVVVQLQTSSSAWLARWVLSFGTDVEILQPTHQRAFMARYCREAAAAYSAAPPQIARKKG